MYIILVTDKNNLLFYVFWNLFLSNAIYNAIDRCPQWHWQHKYTYIHTVYGSIQKYIYIVYILLALTKEREQKSRHESLHSTSGRPDCETFTFSVWAYVIQKSVDCIPSELCCVYKGGRLRNFRISSLWCQASETLRLATVTVQVLGL